VAADVDCAVAVEVDEIHHDVAVAVVLDAAANARLHFRRAESRDHRARADSTVVVAVAAVAAVLGVGPYAGYLLDCDLEPFPFQVEHKQDADRTFHTRMAALGNNSRNYSRNKAAAAASGHSLMWRVDFDAYLRSFHRLRGLHFAACSDALASSAGAEVVAHIGSLPFRVLPQLETTPDWSCLGVVQSCGSAVHSEPVKACLPTYFQKIAASSLAAAVVAATSFLAEARLEAPSVHVHTTHTHQMGRLAANNLGLENAAVVLTSHAFQDCFECADRASVGSSKTVKLEEAVVGEFGRQKEQIVFAGSAAVAAVAAVAELGHVAMLVADGFAQAHLVQSTAAAAAEAEAAKAEIPLTHASVVAAGRNAASALFASAVGSSLRHQCTYRAYLSKVVPPKPVALEASELIFVERRHQLARSLSIRNR